MNSLTFIYSVSENSHIDVKITASISSNPDVMNAVLEMLFSFFFENIRLTRKPAKGMSMSSGSKMFMQIQGLNKQEDFQYLILLLNLYLLNLECVQLCIHIFQNLSF